VIRISNLYIYNQYSKSIIVKVLRADQAGGTSTILQVAGAGVTYRVAEGSQVSVDNMS
jgi:hypothetical protein